MEINSSYPGKVPGFEYGLLIVWANVRPSMYISTQIIIPVADCHVNSIVALEIIFKMCCSDKIYNMPIRVYIYTICIYIFIYNIDAD